MAEGGALNLPAPGILDIDPEGSTLSLVDADPALPGVQPDTVPAAGLVVLGADGSFSYTHLGSEATVDPDSTITAVEQSDPTNGILTLHPNGSFSYVHDGSEPPATRSPTPPTRTAAGP